MRFHFLLFIVCLAVFLGSCQRTKTEEFLPANASVVVALDLKNTGSNLVDFSTLLGGGTSGDSLWSMASKAMDSGVDVNGRVCLALFPDTVTGLSTQAVFIPLSNRNDFKQFLESEFKGQTIEGSPFSTFESSTFRCMFNNDMAFAGIDLGAGTTPSYMLAKVAVAKAQEDLPFSSLFNQSFELATWTNLTKLPLLGNLAQVSNKMELTTYTSFKKGSIETIGLLKADEDTGPLLSSIFQDPMSKAKVEAATEPGTIAQIHFQISVENLWKQLDKMGKLTEFRINAALMGFDAELMKNMVSGSYSISLVEATQTGFTPFGSLRFRVGLKDENSFQKMMKGFTDNGSMKKIDQNRYESQWFANTLIEKTDREVVVTLGETKWQDKSGAKGFSDAPFPSDWTFEPINFQAKLDKMHNGMQVGASLSDLFISARPEKNGEMKLKLVVKTNKPEENALKTLLEASQKSSLFSKYPDINL